MDAMKIIVRSAVQEDAAMIAKAVEMAIGDEVALRHYCGEDYHAALAEVACRRDTQYSWQNALIAEVDGMVAGAVVGYDGAELYTLREGTFAVLSDYVRHSVSIVDETSAGEFYLDSLAVLPEYRGMGVGSRLLTAAAEKAFKAGHERVGLIVDFDNPRAEALYSLLGFERVNATTFLGHKMWHMQKRKG